MAFVDIKERKSAIEVELMLRPYKRGKDITPEVCYDVLEGTNYWRNVRDMLVCIDQLPVEKQAAFKDVVCATFDNREQREDIRELGQKLAETGGYTVEFAEAGVLKGGNYLYSAVGKEMDMVIGEGETRHSFQGFDFSEYKKLKILAEAGVDLSGAKNLPREIDTGPCKNINLSRCDLATVENIKFGEGAEVFFSWSSNLPETLDVSMCGEVHFNHCNLGKVKNLIFKNSEQGFYSKYPAVSKECKITYADIQKKNQSEKENGQKQASSFAAVKKSSDARGR